MTKFKRALHINLSAWRKNIITPSFFRPFRPGAKFIARVRTGDLRQCNERHDVSNLGKIIKKIVTWFRELFNNE